MKMACPWTSLTVAAVPVGTDLQQADMLLRLIAAAVMGALIGWERGRADKPADSRTMMLVSVGAAGFVLLGMRVVVDVPTGVGIQTDPTRVLSYIVSGVGFLGAGSILHSKKTVRGLTTASSIWCTAAVGAACGLGELTVAFFIFAIVFVTLWTPWVYYELRGIPPSRRPNPEATQPQNPFTSHIDILNHDADTDHDDRLTRQ
jgi:putative Mg2+ transporter-C (MgtC) family protein